MPTTQAGGNTETSSTARLPSSSLRWTSMTLRMYAASSLAAAVEDLLADGVELLAEVSMSSAVRWAIGFVGLLLE